MAEEGNEGVFMVAFCSNFSCVFEKMLIRFMRSPQGVTKREELTSTLGEVWDAIFDKFMGGWVNIGNAVVTRGREFS
jgi:hypothetical protein